MTGTRSVRSEESHGVYVVYVKSRNSVRSEKRIPREDGSPQSSLRNRCLLERERIRFNFGGIVLQCRRMCKRRSINLALLVCNHTNKLSINSINDGHDLTFVVLPSLEQTKRVVV